MRLVLVKMKTKELTTDLELAILLMVYGKEDKFGPLNPLFSFNTI